MGHVYRLHSLHWDSIVCQGREEKKGKNCNGIYMDLLGSRRHADLGKIILHPNYIRRSLTAGDSFSFYFPPLKDGGRKGNWWERKGKKKIGKRITRCTCRVEPIYIIYTVKAHDTWTLPESLVENSVTCCAFYLWHDSMEIVAKGVRAAPLSLTTRIAQFLIAWAI